MYLRVPPKPRDVLAILLLAGICLIQCTKENEPSCTDEIVIGASSPEVVPQILDRGVQLAPRFDTLYYTIDLDNDGNQDLTLKAFASQFFGGMALSRSRMSLQTNNAMTTVLTDSLHFVRMVSQNEIIHRENAWEQGEFIMVTASDPCCPPSDPGAIMVHGTPLTPVILPLCKMTAWGGSR